MKRLGESIGAQLRGGEVIELVGDVGAGKTTLTKGIASGFGVEEGLQSPSFTLSRLYEAAENKRLAHYDFYRLSDPGILADELSETAGQPDTVVVVEWADVVKGVLPENRITVHIAPTLETERQVVISGMSL